MERLERLSERKLRTCHMHCGAGQDYAHTASIITLLQTWILAKLSICARHQRLQSNHANAMAMLSIGYVHATTLAICGQDAAQTLYCKISIFYTLH